MAGLLNTFAGDRCECPAISIERCLFAGRLLPTRYDHVCVLGIQLHAVADPRSVNSAAARVVPLPRNGSYTNSPRFCVG